MTHTDSCSQRLIRLPIWNGMPSETPSIVIRALLDALAISG
jgi:hypothetical protein